MAEPTSTAHADLPAWRVPSAPYAFEPGRIWLIEYPIRYMGIHCNARTTLIRTESGGLIVHSPAPLTPETRAAVDGLGPVTVILAPGTYHNLYARQWADAYPEAELFVCPGLERQDRSLRHGRVIAEGVSYGWSAELDHVVTRGSVIIDEVAFFHRATRTLVLTDVLEYFTDATPCNWVTKFWLKYVFRMWNRPAPAPEYRLGWIRRAQAREVLERILAWDFTRIIIGHGELIHADANAMARQAWAPFLK